MVLDAFIALSVLLLMSLLIGSTMSHNAAADRALADRRAATRIAELVLAGETESFDGATIEVAQVGDGWVTVTVRYGGATATLTGREAAP